MRTDLKLAKSKDISKYFAENQEAAVRYVVKEVDSAVSLYSGLSGFRVDLHAKSKFVSLSFGNLGLFINSPGAEGRTSDARWNRTPVAEIVFNCRLKNLPPTPGTPEIL